MWLIVIKANLNAKQCWSATFPCCGYAEWLVEVGGGGWLQGFVWFYSLAVEINSCSLPVSLCAQRLHFLPSLPLCGKHEVSIIVPLFFQCDSARWLLLTGLSWLPHTLGSCACRSNIFPVTFPKLIYC